MHQTVFMCEQWDLHNKITITNKTGRYQNKHSKRVKFQPVTLKDSSQKTALTIFAYCFQAVKVCVIPVWNAKWALFSITRTTFNFQVGCTNFYNALTHRCYVMHKIYLLTSECMLNKNIILCLQCKCTGYVLIMLTSYRILANGYFQMTLLFFGVH